MSNKREITPIVEQCSADWQRVQERTETWLTTRARCREHYGLTGRKAGKQAGRQAGKVARCAFARWPPCGAAMPLILQGVLNGETLIIREFGALLTAIEIYFDSPAGACKGRQIHEGR